MTPPPLTYALFTPMRVLHLIELRDDSEESRAACRAAVAIDSARHRVIGIGSAADAAQARASGVPVEAFAPAIAPWPEMSSRRLRRLISDRDGRNATRPWADVVQCWSPELLGLARLSSGQRTPPRVGALLRPPLRSHAGLDRTRLEFGFRFATTFAFDRFVRSSWAAAVSARRGGTYLEQDIRLLSPPMTRPDAPGDDHIARRAAARAALGLHPADVAISLLADPPGAGNAAAFAFILGLLFTTGARVVGIVRCGGTQQRRGLRFVRMHGRRWGLVPVPDRAGLGARSLLEACDLGLWMASNAPDSDRHGVASGSLSIVDALGRGVPVVAARHPISLGAIGGLDNSHDADGLRASLIARDQTFNALTDRLLPLVHDAARRATLSAQCRAWGQRSTWGDAFEHDLPRLWQEVTNTPVQRIGLPTPLAMLEGAA